MSSGRFIGNPPRKQSILSAESEESHKSGSPVSRRPTAGFTITPDLHSNSGICFSFRGSGRPNRARPGFRFGRPARRQNAASGSQADVFPLLWHRLERHTKGEAPRPPRQSTSQPSLLSATRKNGRLPHCGSRPSHSLVPSPEPHFIQTKSSGDAVHRPERFRTVDQSL